jgi:hypothetical protein
MAPLVGASALVEVPLQWVADGVSSPEFLVAVYILIMALMVAWAARDGR